MQVVEDPCGLHVKLEINQFYQCRFCTTLFVKLNPLLFKDKTKRFPCMFCDQLFVYPADRDYHMCHEHENEIKPIIHCSDCSDTFECIH